MSGLVGYGSSDEDEDGSETAVSEMKVYLLFIVLIDNRLLFP